MVTQNAAPSPRALPDPEVVPAMNLWPETGVLLGLSRDCTYDAARRGEIPTLQFGRRKVVPTASLRRMLGLDGGGDGAP
jgi:hypothetical protein